MAWALIEKLTPEAPTKQLPKLDAPTWYVALFAALAIVENDLHKSIQEQDRIKQERVRQWLEQALEVGALPPIDRAAAGRVINHIGGDRRPGVCQVKDGVPVIAWVEVPAGEFLMGNTKDIDPQVENDEMPQHTVELPAYRISKYPVTNAQYRAFVEGGGYTDEWRECWTVDGWEWKGAQRGPNDGLLADFLLPNHPRVNVTWYEAHAFCRWLSKQRSEYKDVRLPTEAEWEKAARGTDGWCYPWGNEFDATKCNTKETGINQTSAVGMFPDGASPYGALDMGGNVWEWTSSNWGIEALEPDFEYPYDPGGSREDVSAGREVLRVLRGGMFFFSQTNSRATNRDRVDPYDCYDCSGFRLVTLI